MSTTIGGISSALGNIIKFEYTPDGKLLSKTDHLGNKSVRDYINKGNVAQIGNMDTIEFAFAYNIKACLPNRWTPRAISRNTPITTEAR